MYLELAVGRGVKRHEGYSHLFEEEKEKEKEKGVALRLIRNLCVSARPPPPNVFFL